MSEHMREWDESCERLRLVMVSSGDRAAAFMERLERARSEWEALPRRVRAWRRVKGWGYRIGWSLGEREA